MLEKIKTFTNRIYYNRTNNTISFEVNNRKELEGKRIKIDIF